MHLGHDVEMSQDDTNNPNGLSCLSSFSGQRTILGGPSFSRPLRSPKRPAPDGGSPGLNIDPHLAGSIPLTFWQFQKLKSACF